MLYFKNSELAYTYHVSVRTVRNWIEAAKQGKLDLDLHSQGNKTYVSNTSRNLSTIEQLVERGKKYRPHRAVKTVTPKPEFYQLFNDAQIYDIIRSINLYKEIPVQYCYFNEGARYWDDYVQKMAEEETPNTLTSTIKLLKENRSYIDEILSPYSRINIIDIGVGNGLSVKDLIQHLSDQRKFGRYIGVDLSASMLNIAKDNLSKWFGKAFPFEGYQLDINYERFSSIIASEYFLSQSDNTANLVLFLGGTLNNLRDPGQVLKTLRDSMTEKDILIHSQKLDTSNSRRYFDFNVKVEESKRLPAQSRFLIELFGINESHYDIETGYDHDENQRYIVVKFNSALLIDFNLKNNAAKKVVSFNKGDTLMLWRARHSNALDIMELFDKNNLHVLQSSQTSDQEYLLTVSRVNIGAVHSK